MSTNLAPNILIIYTPWIDGCNQLAKPLDISVWRTLLNDPNIYLKYFKLDESIFLLLILLMVPLLNYNNIDSQIYYINIFLISSTIIY